MSVENPNVTRTPRISRHNANAMTNPVDERRREELISIILNRVGQRKMLLLLKGNANKFNCHGFRDTSRADAHVINKT